MGWPIEWLGAPLRCDFYTLQRVTFIDFSYSRFFVSSVPLSHAVMIFIILQIRPKL